MVMRDPYNEAARSQCPHFWTSYSINAFTVSLIQQPNLHGDQNDRKLLQDRPRRGSGQRICNTDADARSVCGSLLVNIKMRKNISN